MWEKMALRLFDQVIDKLLRRLTPWIFGGMIGVVVELK